jgi:hypothetical protein
MHAGSIFSHDWGGKKSDDDDDSTFFVDVFVELKKKSQRRNPRFYLSSCHRASLEEGKENPLWKVIKFTMHCARGGIRSSSVRNGTEPYFYLFKITMKFPRVGFSLL